MSLKRPLMCVMALALTSGLKTLGALAQVASSNDPSAATASRSLFGPATTKQPGMLRMQSRKPIDAAQNAVKIAPTKLGPNTTSTSGGDDFLSLKGFDLKGLIARIYNVNLARIDLPSTIDASARYDVSVKLAQASSDAAMNILIRKAIEDRFHLTASRVSRATDVYVVSALGDPPASSRATPPTVAADADISTTSSSSVGFRVVASSAETPASMRLGIDDIDSIAIPAATLDDFCQTLEQNLDRPVVNETHLQGIFSFNLKSSIDAQNDLLAQLRSKMNLVIQPLNRGVEIMLFQFR